MGTAGPLALARDILDDGQPFFVLNRYQSCILGICGPSTCAKEANGTCICMLHSCGRNGPDAG